MKESFNSRFPSIPPSVNNYVQPHALRSALQDERGRSIREGGSHLLPPHPFASPSKHGEVKGGPIYLGFNQKGDVDNFGKVVLDSLVSDEDH
jgi:hypothetical protein